MKRNTALITFAYAFAIIVAPSSASAGDLYVNTSTGSDAYSGTTWNSAKKSIRSAYNIANDGDVIHVADGKYSALSVNTEKSLTIKSVNGPSKTVIDGGGTSRCTAFFYTDWSTPYTDIVVDGFTITHGYCSKSGGAAYGGTFRNCRFIENASDQSGGAGYKSILHDCTVVSNSAGDRAGAVYGGKIFSSTVSMNSATNWGGAFYECEASNCVVVSNWCGQSGGAAYGGIFQECEFAGNRCERSGGVGYEAILYNCTAISNVAGNCAGVVYGGKIYSCIALQNTATNWGGAFYGCDIRNSIIAGNYCGRYGGGAYEGTLIGCSVFANIAGLGAAGSYHVAATNTILWANKTSGGELSNWSEGSYGYCVLKPNVEGLGNSDRDPMLYSIKTYDARLCAQSSCLDAGLNSCATETLDVAKNARILNNTIDIGALEGAVDGTGDRLPEVDKYLDLKPRAHSSFTLTDGSSAFVFGVAPLTASDFVAHGTVGELRYVNENIIDAEKVKSFDANDLWCQKMTEVNLSVWAGWSDYVGFTDEDDFAEYLREHADFFESTNVLKWVFAHVPKEYAYDEFVKRKLFIDYDSVVTDLLARTSDARCWVYLQMDWVDSGTTNIIGSHAVTCCGYAIDQTMTSGSPQSLKGLFIINSDNDKSTGDGGRLAPNSISYYPVEWDAVHSKFMLKWTSGRDGMLRFLCYLYKRPCAEYGEAGVVTEGGAIPYSWLSKYGLFSPDGAQNAETAAKLNWRHYVAGTNPNEPSSASNCFCAVLHLTNDTATISWTPNLGDARRYVVYGKGSLDPENSWHTPVAETDRFFKVSVDLCEPITVTGHGIISTDELSATNAYVKYSGLMSLIDPRITDAEKIEGTDLDDRGCGEATGANLTWMTGWAQMAGFASEDDVFKQFYSIDGTAEYGVKSVVKFVFDKIADYDYGHFYQVYDTFTPETFKQIDNAISAGEAVGIYYAHGTPQANNGNHVVTVWGVCKDKSFLPTDPRHYCGVIISDSDDDKYGYSNAEDAPNRVKFRSVTWDDDDEVYYIHDGYLCHAYILSPPS